MRSPEGERLMMKARSIFFPTAGSQTAAIVSAVMAILVFAGGCRGTEEVGTDFLEQTGIDTVGVQTILIADWPALERVDPRPVLEFGSERSPDMSPLYRVIDVLARSDGGFLIGNSGNNEVLSVNVDGDLEWRAGRPGDGPGEFRSIVALHEWKADTIVAVDVTLSRVTFLTTEGQIVKATASAKAVQGEGVPEGSLLLPSFLGGSFPDGQLVFEGPSTVAPLGAPGLRRQVTPITTIDGSGNQRTLFSIPGPWWYELKKPDVLPVTITRMSGVAPIAFDAEGIVWARKDHPEVLVFDSSGTPVLIIRLNVPGERLTQTIRRSYLDEWRPQFPTDEELPFPADEMPFFDEVFRSLEGDIWVRRYDWQRDLREGVPEEWVQIGVTSGSHGRYLFPERVRVVEAGVGAAFGVASDTLGIETVVKFRLPE